MINKKNLVLLFSIILLISFFSSLNNNKIKTTDTEEKFIKRISLYEKENNLIKGTYDFKYIIEDKIKVIFRGTYDKGSVTGKYTSDDKSFDYIIKNKTTYILKDNKKEPYKDLYTNLDYRLFDFDNIFKSIKEKNYVKKIDNNKTTYIYNYIDYKLNIETDDTSITKIVFYKDKTNYTFNFFRK